MLLELRTERGLVIYDNFLEGMYKAAWDYLYKTTLKSGLRVFVCPRKDYTKKMGMFGLRNFR